MVYTITSAPSQASISGKSEMASHSVGVMLYPNRLLLGKCVAIGKGLFKAFLLATITNRFRICGTPYDVAYNTLWYT
jgi:hypothetical protein